VRDRRVKVCVLDVATRWRKLCGCRSTALEQSARRTASVRHQTERI